MGLSEVEIKFFNVKFEQKSERSQSYAADDFFVKTQQWKILANRSQTYL